MKTVEAVVYDSGQGMMANSSALSYGGPLPAISVVIPSFNQACYLEDCLLSVIGQGYPLLELIVMDGGSVDGSVKILERFGSDITFWRSRPDEGQAAAINEGMSLARGDVLCWLNSDDMLMPGTLLHVGAHFGDRRLESLLLCGSSITLDCRKAIPEVSIEHPARFDPGLLAHYDYLVQPSCFWTRKLWEEAGELDPCYNFTLDWEWFLRAAAIGKFEISSRVCSVYRRHPEHKSGQGSFARRGEIEKVVQKYSSRYWAKLYRRVNDNFESLRRKSELIECLRLPKRQWILPFLCPSFLPRLRNLSDLQLALNMLR